MIEQQYITDSESNKLSVVLPIRAYENMLKIIEEWEDMEDVRLYDEAKAEDDGERILFEDYLKSRESNMPKYTVSISKKAVMQLDKLNDATANKFWLGLQDDYNLEEALKTKAGLLNAIQLVSIDAT